MPDGAAANRDSRQKRRSSCDGEQTPWAASGTLSECARLGRSNVK